MGRAIGRVGAILAAAVAAVLLGAGEALACPQCALGRDEGPARDLLVAGMMAAPFVVVLVVTRAIARLVRSARSRPPGQDGEEEEPL
jgi:hypothetical protein